MVNTAVITPPAKALIKRASGEPSIDARAATKVFDAAARAGVKPETLARAASLDLALLQRADAQMPFNDLIALYEQAAELSGDAAFGLGLGEESDHSKYDLLGYVVANSRTYGDALRHVVRYLQVWTDAVQFALASDGGEARLTYIYSAGAAAPDLRRQESEHMLSAMLHIGRQLTGRRWKPKHVCFEHRKPARTAAHKRVFQAPVHFGCARTELVFDARLLEQPLPKADPALAALLQRNAQALLGPIAASDTCAGQVRHVLSKVSAPGDLQLAVVARKLGTSARTLQRRLSEEGSSFHELVHETRSTLAKNYLRKGELAICEIAYLLGFSQPSAFHRAFQRWTGMTPRTFRNSRSR
jgi:AraC-like DNA-binding protein